MSAITWRVRPGRDIICALGTRRGHLLALALSAAVGGTVLATPAPASAEGEEGGGESGAYWFASFLGGAAMPAGSMTEGRKEGLAATARFGFSAKNGLGFALNALYSPLPYKTLDSATTIQPHLGLLSGAARFTLGQGAVRVWLAAGGGMALERTTITHRGLPEETEFGAEPMALGEAGVGLHMFENGGLTVSGGYARSFGEEVEARLYSVQGGLVFTFH